MNVPDPDWKHGPLDEPWDEYETDDTEPQWDEEEYNESDEGAALDSYERGREPG